GRVGWSRARESTTTPRDLGDELAAAIDEADAAPEVRVILLRADGPAFCAGSGLDWAVAGQAAEGRRSPDGRPGRAWDSVADWRMMKRFVDTYMKLWYAQKPTIAAVTGWCIGGGTHLAPF